MGRSRTSVAELESLYRDRYLHFVGVAASLTGEVESGRDAVQLAFAAAVKRRSSFRGDGSLEAWVWRIVVNEAKRIATARADQPLEQAEEPSSNGHSRDELGIRAWVATLPERQRTAVFLRYYADLDYRTIARVLDVEAGTVSATLSAAHRTLRKLLMEVRP